MANQVTICTRCGHFLNLEPGSVREHIWYNHLCKASPLPKGVDPYDGKEKACSINAFGGRYFSDNEFQYCRDVNDGNCQQFQDGRQDVVWVCEGEAE